MIEKFLKTVLCSLAILLLVNVVFLDFVFVREKQPIIQPQSNEISEVKTETNICPLACLEKIQEETEKLVPVAQTDTGSPVVTPTPTSSHTFAVSYFSIGSSASISSGSWVDVPGTEFYFNLADFSGVKSVRWEVNLRAFLAGNAVLARIYDVTNNRAVDGSELSTTSGTSVILRSGVLTIWQGNNLYRIQAKSTSENPLFIDAPRLKIVLD